MALYTSLSGLKAAQTDLSVISNNIANVSTTGFKSSRTEFGDLISSSALQAAGSVIGQGTQLKSVSQEFSQGSFQSTDAATDVAISGEGFLVTHSSAAGGQVAYTRDGALTVNADHYLVDSSGDYVQALPVDSQGNVTSKSLSTLENVQLPATSGTAAATNSIAMGVNLPTGDSVPTTTTFDPNDSTSYNQVNSTTIYDSSGNAIPATVYYVRTQSPTDTDATTTYQAHVFVGDKEVSTDPATTPPTPITLTFDGSGALTAPTSATQLATTFPSGASASLSLSMNFSGTQMSNASFSVASVSQDGKTTGKLSNLTIGSDGLITATYSDGTSKPLGKLAMATFANSQGLQQLGNASWAVTGNSGAPTIGEAGSDGYGTLQSGALEASNVDLTAELVSLISAQRNFQANAKAIDTDNQMTTTIIQLQG